MASIDLHTNHERSFAGNRFVYPVLSRRSKGISVGVNLNPDKICNFDCIYCQVDRTRQSETRFIEMESLLAELRTVAALVASDDVYKTEKFAHTPGDLRRLNDIAFSGDGEPTTYKNFDQIIASCAQVKRDLGLDATKMVLITNASMFHRPRVRRGLEILHENQGEVWAKLEAGTDAYYQLIERTPIKFQQVLDNIAWAAAQFPLVIQSLFMKVHGEGPSEQELTAYCDRLNTITHLDGAIRLVQVYTVARRPAEDFVQALTDAQVDHIVELVRDRTGLVAEPYYGAEF